MRSRKGLHNLTPTQRVKRVFKLAALVLVSICGLIVSPQANAGPWAEHLSKIPALKRDVEGLEGEIKHLIHEKRESHNEEDVKNLTHEIAEKYKSLRETGEKLEAETEHVRFKHPEQADTLDRQYVRYKTKTLGEIEGEVGIDGKLDRIRTHVLATFPVPPEAEEKSVEPKVNPFFIRAPASAEDQDAPEKIILKK